MAAPFSAPSRSASQKISRSSTSNALLRSMPSNTYKPDGADEVHAFRPLVPGTQPTYATGDVPTFQRPLEFRRNHAQDHEALLNSQAGVLLNVQPPIVGQSQTVLPPPLPTDNQGGLLLTREDAAGSGSSQIRDYTVVQPAALPTVTPAPEYTPPSHPPPPVFSSHNNQSNLFDRAGQTQTTQQQQQQQFYSSESSPQPTTPEPSDYYYPSSADKGQGTYSYASGQKSDYSNVAGDNVKRPENAYMYYSEAPKRPDNNNNNSSNNNNSNSYTYYGSPSSGASPDGKNGTYGTYANSNYANNNYGNNNTYAQADGGVLKNGTSYATYAPADGALRNGTYANNNNYAPAADGGVLKNGTYTNYASAAATSTFGATTTTYGETTTSYNYGAASGGAYYPASAAYGGGPVRSSPPVEGVVETYANAAQPAPVSYLNVNNSSSANAYQQYYGQTTAVGQAALGQTAITPEDRPYTRGVSYAGGRGVAGQYDNDNSYGSGFQQAGATTTTGIYAAHRQAAAAAAAVAAYKPVSNYVGFNVYAGQEYAGVARGEAPPASAQIEYDGQGIVATGPQDRADAYGYRTRVIAAPTAASAQAAEAILAEKAHVRALRAASRKRHVSSNRAGRAALRGPTTPRNTRCCLC